MSVTIGDLISLAVRLDLPQLLGVWVSSLAALGTIAAVAVAVLTSSRATKLATEANAIAWAAIESQRESTRSEFEWRRASARRDAGRRLLVWLPMFMNLTDEGKNARETGAEDRELTEEERHIMGFGAMTLELEASGYAGMSELISHIAVWIHNLPVSTETFAELVNAMERRSKMRWQLRTAVDRWQRDPDPEATLYRAFRVLDDEAQYMWPNVGSWDWESAPFPDR